MYQRSILALVCLTATALAQEDGAVRPAIVTVSAPTSATTTNADLDRNLLKLKAQREALAAEQDTAKQLFPDGPNWANSETTKLRVHLGQLINKLSALPDGKVAKDPVAPSLPQPAHLAVPPSSPPPGLGAAQHGDGAGKKAELAVTKQPTDLQHSKAAPQEMPNSSSAADALALAHVLFKAGSWELALKAYRMVNITGLRADERAPVQYLMASCLRKMGKLDEAMALYREVANIRGDEQVAACAQWQLVQLRWQGEFEAQIKDARERRKALEANK